MGHPIRRSRLEDAITGLDADEPDDRALRRRMLEVIGRAVPHEFFAFVLTDPLTTVGCSPLAEVPRLAELPRLVRLKYLTVLGRWTSLPAPGCTTLVAATEGDLARSALWVGAMRGHGVSDVLLAVLRDRYGTWAFLDLWRTGGPFRDDEVQAVSHALPLMTAQLRAAVARTFARSETSPQPGRHGPGVLLLTPDLVPVAGTPQLHDWLAGLLPPEAGATPVPASAINVAAQLLAVEAGVDDHAPMSRLPVAPGMWLTVRAARLAEDGIGAPIAVGYEQASPSDRLEVFVRAFGLSPRERDVVAAVAGGLDTRAVGRALGIAELTVQDHLKAVFARTGTATRADLLARAIGLSGSAAGSEG